jgi:hypothetical protein
MLSPVIPKKSQIHYKHISGVFATVLSLFPTFSIGFMVIQFEKQLKTSILENHPCCFIR